MRWKVDRVLANQRLNLIAGTQVTSNVPKAWFLVLGCNRQDGKGMIPAIDNKRGKRLPVLPTLPTLIAFQLMLSLASPTFQSIELSVRLGHKRLRTLMKRSSLWYLPGVKLFLPLVSASSSLTKNSRN